MTEVLWGVLGTAEIAATRTIAAMKEARNARLVAIASRAGDKAKAFAQALDIPRHFGSYEALLADAEIDAVYVPLPNHMHVEWSVRALEAGKHVLCEKPLCLSSADVLKLQAARDRTGRHIEEAFSYRNHPQWTKIQEILTSGVIGSPLAVQCLIAKQFLDPNDIRNNPDQGGGGLYDTGSYTISSCSAVFNRAPDRVMVTLDRDPTFRIDRLSTAVLDYGGRHATFTVATRGGPSSWGTHQHFSILASDGWLRCDFPYAHGRPTGCHVYVGDTGSVGNFPTSTFSFEPVNQYTLQIERFSRYLLGERVAAWPIEDALTTLRIVEALFESARGGQWRSVGN